MISSPLWISIVVLSCIDNAWSRQETVLEGTTTELKKKKNHGSVFRWLKKNDGPTIDDLQTKFSDVPDETIQRFYKGFNGGEESIDKLIDYLIWKKVHEIKPSTGNDTQDWIRAMDESYNYITHGQLRGSPYYTQIMIGNPPYHQVMFNHYNNITDNDGYTILQVIPNRMDLSIDRAHEIYSTAMASYIATKFENYHNNNNNNTAYYNNNNNKISLLIDVRPGRGWANPAMLKMMNTVKQICNSITDLHPERIHKVYVFPIPKVAMPFWTLLKPFLSKSVTDNVFLIPSDRCDRHAPVPKQYLNKYISEKYLNQLEDHRLRLFTKLEQSFETVS